MKMNKKITITAGYLALVVSIMGLLSSCMGKEPSLGALPVPSFTSVTLTPTNNAPANLQLINTTPPPSIAFWYIPDLGLRLQGDTANVTFVYAGDYPVQLIVTGQGGLDSCTQVVNVPESNPYAINSNSIFGLLSGAGIGLSQRVWIPERVINSVVVWDSYADCLDQIDNQSGAWWAFGPGEIATDGTGRDGYLDDKYTFTLDKVGKFIFDDNNTVFLDGGGSGWTAALPDPWNSYTGTTSSTDLFNLVPALKPWASGSFTYAITNVPTGAMFRGTVTVNGLGAHIGLPDKSNGSADIVPTATSIKYDILRINQNLTDAKTGATYDEIILGVNDSVHYWSFMLRSDQ